MSENIKAGHNYVARRQASQWTRTADVLKVGNGMVVYRDIREDAGDFVTKELKVATINTFRRIFNITKDVESELTLPKAAKSTILKAVPEAAVCWN
jgi:hypothetical protein